MPGLPIGDKAVDINDIVIVKSFWKEDSFSRFTIDIIKII